MFVTPDVLRLSGWLNEDALCRAERTSRGVCNGGKSTHPKRGNETIGRGKGSKEIGGTQGKRTLNISFMLVTLEVSKLSGWLNACAYCRVESVKG